MKYVLYAKKTCPFCVKAEAFLQEQKKDFKIIDLEDHESVLQDIKEAYNWFTVPMVFAVGDEISFIGGYTDLIEHFDG